MPPTHSILDVKNFSLRLHNGDVLVQNANFSICKGEKKALIGRNGSGKSTLMEIIANGGHNKKNDYVEMSGEINILPSASFGYLSQDVALMFGGTVGEYLDSCVQYHRDTYERYYFLLQRMSHSTTPEELEEFNTLSIIMEQENLWDFLERKKRTIKIFGLQEIYLNRKINEISGGEATRLALIGILFRNPQLILLDEPTNNLDEFQIQFLTDFLKTTKSSVLLISHDRKLLDDVVQDILEINEHTKQIQRYGGNYIFYKQRKDEEFMANMRQYQNQLQQKKHLMQSVRQLNERAQQFEDFSTNAFMRSKGAKIAKRAKGQKKRIETELSEIDLPKEPLRPKFTVIEMDSVPHDRTILSCKDISFGYDQRSLLLRDVSLKCRYGERLAIVGPNGSGKSTLLQILIGDITPLSGEVIRSFPIAYLPQRIVRKNNNDSLVSFLGQRLSLPEKEISNILGRLIFRNPMRITLKETSEGELKKCYLSLLFAMKAPILILDEPTNHLDILTIEMFEDALTKYPGSMIFVSHDRCFLDNINIDKYLDIMLYK